MRSDVSLYCVCVCCAANISIAKGHEIKINTVFCIDLLQENSVISWDVDSVLCVTIYKNIPSTKPILTPGLFA